MGCTMGRGYCCLKNTLFYSILFISFFSAIKLPAQEANVDSLFNAILDNSKRGIELIKNGDKSAGLKAFSNAIEAYGDYDYWKGNKRDSTLNVFISLEKENPKSPVFALILAKQIRIMKSDSINTAKAIELTKKALAIEPKFAKAYSFLANIAAMQNNNKEAIEYYKKAIIADPDNLAFYLYLSSILKKEKNESEAKLWTDKMIQKDSSDYYSIAALIEIAKGKSVFKEKYNLFFNAFRLAKEDNKEYPIQSIISFLTVEAPDSAILFCKRLLKSNLGKDRKMKVRAIESIFQNLVRADKKSIPAFAEENYNCDDPRLLADIGRYYADSLKNNELSLKFYLKAYEITTPETVENTIAFGGGSTIKEFLAKTAKEYKEGSMAASIGRKYYELKDYKNAEKYLRESIEGNEKNRSNYPHQYLAYSLAELGKKEEAVQWLAKALAMKSVPEAEKRMKELVKELKLRKSADELVKEERMKTAKQAKDFTLNNLYGKAVQLSNLKGKVVMLDFWGTWCGPCVSELPNLVKLYDKYKDNPDVVFYGVDVNEQPPVIKKFMEEKKYSFNVLISDGTTVQKDYGVTAVPTKFLIDKQGRIQFSHIGANNKIDVVDELSKEIDELLNMK